jgi:hypothetical protein
VSAPREETGSHFVGGGGKFEIAPGTQSFMRKFFSWVIAKWLPLDWCRLQLQQNAKYCIIIIIIRGKAVPVLN